MLNTIEAEGFKTTTWLTQTLEEIEALKSNTRETLTLAPDIDFRFFVSKLGEPVRNHEIGGLYSPSTRSLLVVRGYASGENGTFSNAHTNYLAPRANEDGITDDIFFHTHPWQPNSPVSYLTDPKNSCQPSDNDTNLVMANRMIEEEDDFSRTVTSLIGSGGCISITEANGISLDEEALFGQGITPDQVIVIKQKLALEPPVWLKNLAIDQDAENLLIEQARKFYLLRSTNNGIGFKQKVQETIDSVKPLIRARSVDLFEKDVIGHIPEYPTITFLQNSGLTYNQARSVQEMTGIKISVFRVIENVGLEQVK